MRKVNLCKQDFDLLQIVAAHGHRINRNDIPDLHRRRGTMTRLVAAGMCYRDTFKDTVKYITTELGKTQRMEIVA